MNTQAAFPNGRYVGPERRAAWRVAAAAAPSVTMAPAGAARLADGAGFAPLDWPKSVLDELDHGILLLGPDGFLMLINRAAEAELGSDHPLLLAERQLHARDPLDEAQLQDALGAAARRGLQRLLALGHGEQRISLRVVPLGSDAPGLHAVMLQLSRRHVCERLSVQWFAKHHGLTPAETRVLERLCAGEAPRQIADAQNVGLATVRTQIGSVRTKTGAGSIRELVQQVAMLPPMVGRLRN